MISKSTEEYLKTIYVLLKQNGNVRVTDIANKMNCSKPSVTKQLNILSKNNFINYESYGSITLTNQGEIEAKKTLEEDDIIYILLNDIMGVNNETANINASKIKNVIDKETLEAITRYVNKVLGINRLNCNFDIRNEKCRKCIMEVKRV